MANKRDHLIMLCTGNTCRSPMAAKLVQHALDAQEAPLNQITVISAGVAAGTGEPASSNSVRAMARSSRPRSTSEPADFAGTAGSCLCRVWYDAVTLDICKLCRMSTASISFASLLAAGRTMDRSLRRACRSTSNASTPWSKQCRPDRVPQARARLSRRPRAQTAKPARLMPGHSCLSAARPPGWVVDRHAWVCTERCVANNPVPICRP